MTLVNETGNSKYRIGGTKNENRIHGICRQREKASESIALVTGKGKNYCGKENKVNG